MSIDKFNSTSGFEFDIDNIISKIRLDFDTSFSIFVSVGYRRHEFCNEY